MLADAALIAEGASAVTRHPSRQRLVLKCARPGCRRTQQPLKSTEFGASAAIHLLGADAI